MVPTTTQFQNSGVKANNSKFTPENKTKPDNSVQTNSKFQPALSKSSSPPPNSQQLLCTDTKPQTTTFVGLPMNESSKTIDLSSLSAVLEEKNKEETSTAVMNDITDDKSKSDHKPQNTSMYFIYFVKNWMMFSI